MCYICISNSASPVKEESPLNCALSDLHTNPLLKDCDKSHQIGQKRLNKFSIQLQSGIFKELALKQVKSHHGVKSEVNERRIWPPGTYSLP